MTAMTLERPAAAEPAIRRALKAFLGDQVSGAERLQWGTLVQTATWAVWDYDSWLVLSSRDVEVARVSGALTPLSIFLSALASAATMCGDFETAASLPTRWTCSATYRSAESRLTMLG